MSSGNTLSRFQLKRLLPASVMLFVLIAAEAELPGSSIATDFSTPIELQAESVGSAIQLRSPTKLEAERITLNALGFEPKEITRPTGRFLLAVNDRSGQRGVALVLSRQNGGLLHEVRMRDTRRKLEWRHVVSLPPGRYLLAEAHHPEWVCRITITAD